jgi:hypothetical protein
VLIGGNVGEELGCSLENTTLSRWVIPELSDEDVRPLDPAITQVVEMDGNELVPHSVPVDSLLDGVGVSVEVTARRDSRLLVFRVPIARLYLPGMMPAFCCA